MVNLIELNTFKKNDSKSIPMKNSEVQKRRDKLIEQFELMIQDEQKMDQLENIFLNLLQDGNSKLSDEQWAMIEQRDADFISGKESGTSWANVKKKIRSRNEI